MNIIYFTTSIDKEDFADFMKHWSVPLNPSNQNFHEKMIDSLAITNHVDVISIRPFSKSGTDYKFLKEEEKTDKNKTWHYLKIIRNRALKMFSLKKQVVKLFKTLPNDAIVLTDTINPTVLYFATKFSKKFKRKIYGICTDSPSNITGTTKSYTLFLLNLASGLDGYISLTSGLNDLYNSNKSPALIIEGIIEQKPDFKPTANEYGSYFFFGGAMLERYGVYNLIKAYKLLGNCGKKLIICGHHYDLNRINKEIKDNQNIIFLGMIPVDQVLSLEMNAFANINPRPYTKDLDILSMPSKTIEYLSSGRLTISVKNTKLQSLFSDDAIWANSGSVDDLYLAMKQSMELSTYNKTIIEKSAKQKSIELFSKESINKKISEFLNNASN